MEFLEQYYMWIILAVAITQSVVITSQNSLKHITLLGKYWKTAEPGLSFKIPFFSGVDQTVSTKRNEHEIELSLKTSDEVTFKVIINVISRISKDTKLAYKVSYEFEDYEEQIKSVATNAVISVANSLTLSSIFSEKDKIVGSAKDALNAYFSEFGLIIEDVLSDEPVMPKAVEDSANEVVASLRLKESAQNRADAVKIEKVGEARADAESIKIRMEESGKAKEEYADKTALAMEKIIDKGVTPSEALMFFKNIGDQDALVAASRNGSSTIIVQGDNSNKQTDVVALVEALNTK